MATYTIEISQIIKKTNIFDFDYDLYDEEKKDTLEKSFISRYLTREIGFETIGRFKEKLKNRWLSLIEKYNKLWVANQKEIDIFNNNKGRSKRSNQFNELPITPPIGAQDYPTTSTKEDNEYTSMVGASEIEMLDKYNRLLTNITKKFLDEFETLFMLIY